MNLEYERFHTLLTIIHEDYIAEQKFSLISAAFTAWLVLRSFGTKTPFDKYCKALGLIEDTLTEEEKEEQRKLEVSRALATAEKIVELDKYRLRHKNG